MLAPAVALYHVAPERVVAVSAKRWVVLQAAASAHGAPHDTNADGCVHEDNAHCDYDLRPTKGVGRPDAVLKNVKHSDNRGALERDIHGKVPNEVVVAAVGGGGHLQQQRESGAGGGGGHDGANICSEARYKDIFKRAI